MQVNGQSAVTYARDADNRLTSIQQGSKTVLFAYDAGGRRSGLTLPNGISALYTYDAASRLTGITYTLGVKVIGNLAYGYDAGGRRVSVGGSLATTLLPTAVAGATVDAANQLTAWNGKALAYDANGRLLSDGQNTYTWNARRPADRHFGWLQCVVRI